MPVEECRCLVQHRPSSVVLLCRRRLDVWPNVSLPPFNTRLQARRHQCRPSFLWGKKNRGKTKSFPWGKKHWGIQEELHPLASTASSTPPQLPLGGETLRNDEEIPLGYKISGTKEDLHPLTSAATSTSPQLPLGDKTPRHNPLASAETSTAPASLGGRNPRDKFMDTEDHAQDKTTTPNLQGCGRNDREELLLGDETLETEEELSLGDENPGTTTTTTPNLRGCGRTTTTKTTRIMGHRKDHGHRGSWTQQEPYTKRQRGLPTTKVEANEAGFSAGM